MCKILLLEKGSIELIKCHYGYDYNLTDLFTTAITDVSIGPRFHLFRGILGKMQSKGLQNCPRTVDCAAVEVRGQFWRPEDCIFPRDPEEKGGFLTLYPGFDGSETGASWEYCFSRCPGFVTNRGDLDSTVFQDTPVHPVGDKPGYLEKQYSQDAPVSELAKPGYNVKNPPFSLGSLGKMQSSGLQNCPRTSTAAQSTVLQFGLHLSQDPSEKGGI